MEMKFWNSLSSIQSSTTNHCHHYNQKLKMLGRERERERELFLSENLSFVHFMN